MNYESWLLWLHILSAMTWLGGGALLAALGYRARASGDARIMGEFSATLPWVGLRILAPSVVLVLLTGIVMVLVSAAWDFTQLWVIVALAIFAVAFVIGAAFLGRVGQQLDRMRATGATAEAMAGLLRQWMIGYGVVLALLVAAVWDMVFKPGL